jgi:hypothetical protein
LISREISIDTRPPRQWGAAHPNLAKYSGQAQSGKILSPRLLSRLSSLVSRYFGLRNYGRLFGIHLGLITAAAALAPLILSAIYTATGNDTTMLALCGAGLMLGALMLLPLGRPPLFNKAE